MDATTLVLTLSVVTRSSEYGTDRVAMTNCGALRRVRSGSSAAAAADPYWSSSGAAEPAGCSVSGLNGARTTRLPPDDTTQPRPMGAAPPL